MRNFLIVSLLFLSVGCEKTKITNNDRFASDQQEMLTHLGENLILPSLLDLESKTASLSTQANAFSSELTIENLALLKESWRLAYIQWQVTAFYQFGPALYEGFISLNIYPANTLLIQDYITSGTYDLKTAGATLAKGFPALDYMLFGYSATESELLVALSGNQNAVDYIKNLCANIHETVSLVANGWKSDQGNYVSTFSNNLGTSSGGGISLMVNSWSQYMEAHLRNAKVGTPNGNSVVTSERFGPFPEKSEAYYNSSITLDLLKTSLQTLYNFYMGIAPDGTDGKGLYDYLKIINAQNGTLADDYAARIRSAQTETDQLNPLFTDAIINQGTEVTDVFNELKALVALLKVDMVSALSISITYADNDGD
ncbi:MAG: imelysin family protein [Cyclobacteriaceae bacterium]|nr:imelysin family protein [Cyclobacteriaceae bacterium]